MAFEWRHGERYEVIRYRTRSGPPAFGEVVSALRAIGPEDRTYRVLTDAPHLFRKFASLEFSDPWLSEFASRYGLLGLRSIDDGIHTESMDEWTYERHDLRRVIQAWDVLHDDAGPEVENQLLMRLKGHPRGSVASRRRELAKIVLEGINAAIKRHELTPRLEITSPDSLEFRAIYEPATLVGAIWTQAIRATTRRTDYIPCWNTCGKWIKRSPVKRGPKARFCSDRCRAAADQRAVARAKQMQRERQSVTAIIAATELPRDRVKRILGIEKKGGR